MTERSLAYDPECPRCILRRSIGAPAAHAWHTPAVADADHGTWSADLRQPSGTSVCDVVSPRWGAR